jgi:lipopolysaccharide transport system ATP-binding protein
MGDVRALADRVILLDKGKVLKDGAPDEVVDFYNALVAAKENAELTVEQRRDQQGWLYTKSGTGEVTAENVGLFDAETGEPISTATVGQTLILKLKAKVHKEVPQLIFGCMIRDRTGHVIWGTNTWHTGQTIADLKSGAVASFETRFVCSLGPGSYSITPALTKSSSHLDQNYEWQDNLVVFDVINVSENYFIGTTAMQARINIEYHE